MATPIYNPLEPTEEIQPKPESITPQEKSEPEQPAPTPPEDQKLRFLLKKKAFTKKKTNLWRNRQCQKKKKQTKETTAHPLQVNKDFVFPNGLGAGGDEESESYLAAVGYFLSGNGLYGKNGCERSL